MSEELASAVAEQAAQQSTATQQPQPAPADLNISDLAALKNIPLYSGIVSGTKTKAV